MPIYKRLNEIEEKTRAKTGEKMEKKRTEETNYEHETESARR